LAIKKDVVTNDLVEMFRTYHGGNSIISYLNDKLKELLQYIVAKRVSLENLKIDDVISFSTVLNCRSLDQNLLDELSHQLYGGDERAKNFKLEFTAP
jgi:hypothetical protein